MSASTHLANVNVCSCIKLIGIEVQRRFSSKMLCSKEVNLNLLVCLRLNLVVGFRLHLVVDFRLNFVVGFRLNLVVGFRLTAHLG